MKLDKTLLAIFIMAIMLAALLAYAMASQRAQAGPHEFIIPTGDEHYSEAEYPRIIDNGNGTMNVLIYPRTVAGYRFPVEFVNEPVAWEGLATTNGPMIVNGISITDWHHELLVFITPLPDGNGSVNITAMTIAGRYNVNGTMNRPLAIKPQNYNMGYTATVKNDSIEVYHGCSWKLATVIESGETFYVIAGVEANDSTGDVRTAPLQ